ncbi:MAG: transglycosylase SLT domain-containing protein [Pseudomonadota bacterium]
MSIEALHGLGSAERGFTSVKTAIRNAARDSGLDFDLMLGVAQRESSLRPDAQASTSSASGLFQFIDQTWLGALKEHGEGLGLGDVAQDIHVSDHGFVVDDPQRRQEILDLRFKPAVAAGVAGKTLAAAKDRLSSALGREASGTEVYMAHFLGERGAARMLQAGESALAATVDPRAAKANQPLFYEGSRPLTVAEFKSKIALGLGDAGQPDTGVSGYQYQADTARVPYRPSAEPRVESYAFAQPGPVVAASKAGGLPNQLFSTILEMEAEFIAGAEADPLSSDQEEAAESWRERDES